MWFKEVLQQKASKLNVFKKQQISTTSSLLAREKVLYDLYALVHLYVTYLSKTVAKPTFP